MRVVTATEAKARLAELLRAVEGGETIAITRHDKAIVHLVPAEARDNAARAATVARFRRQRASWQPHRDVHGGNPRSAPRGPPLVTPFVLDASIAAAWLFDDETDSRAEAALAQLEDAEALVPRHWHLEVRNALLVAERRNRLGADEVNRRLQALATLPVHTDDEPRLDAALALARTHHLSIYDALYLELAQRHAAAIATLDAALARAAVAEGLALV